MPDNETIDATERGARVALGHWQGRGKLA